MFGAMGDFQSGYSTLCISMMWLHSWPFCYEKLKPPLIIFEGLEFANPLQIQRFIAWLPVLASSMTLSWKLFVEPLAPMLIPFFGHLHSRKKYEKLLLSISQAPLTAWLEGWTSRVCYPFWSFSQCLGFASEKDPEGMRMQTHCNHCHLVLRIRISVFLYLICVIIWSVVYMFRLLSYNDT